MGRKSYIDGPAVLFVDDDMGNLKVLQIHMSRDYKVLISQNATDAMEKLERHADEIGLVVADQRMPGTTGTEFLVKVRQRYPAMERMIITAFADLPPIIEAINNGQISGYISKPWNPTEVRVILYGGIERFCLRRSLHEANLKLLRTEQDSVLGFLAAGIGHEINNPAGAVMLNLELLTDLLLPIKATVLEAVSPAELPKRREDFQRIEACITDSLEAVEIISEISKDLRVLSRLDDSDDPAQDPADVNAVIKRSLGFLHNQIKYRGSIRQDLRATLPVKINTSKLTQVLINLCTNAIHAVDEISDGRPEVIAITSWDDPGGWVVIEIEDNGDGIPKEILPRIFDPFFSTKGKKVGLGLGLAISKNIVQLMGGTIKVHSSVGVGTRFVIHLSAVIPVAPKETPEPAAPEETPEPAAPEEVLEPAVPEEAPDPAVRSILVIDDDESLVAAVKRILDDKFSVHVTFDGAAGIKALEGSSFDAILCDLMMATPDGQDVYEYLQQHKADHLDRLLYITGGVFTPRLKKFYAEIEGTMPVLQKPFTLQQVHAAIDKIIT